MARYIEQLNECTDPASADWLWIVDDSAGATDKDRKVSVSKLAVLATANTFTENQLFTGRIAAENGSATPGVGASFDSTTVIATGTMYLVTVRALGGVNTISGNTVSIITRQGTGTLISNIVTAAMTTVSCDSGTSYEVRITNAGGLDYTYAYSLLRLH